MTRINVNFEVKQQQIVWIKEQPLRARDENYFYAVFKLCDKWKNVAGIKAAFFRGEELPYIIDLAESQEVDGCLECLIPWEVMAEKGEFYVGVFGGERILTNKVRVDVGESCYCGGGQSSSPTYDWFREVDERLEELKDTANPLPTGGNAGQVLVKDTADDYAVKWEDVKDYSQDIKNVEQAVIELEKEKADKTDIPTKVSQLDNDKKYATETYVDEAIEAIPPVDLSDYALKKDIPSTTGLATEKYVDNKIAAIPKTDLSNYYTKTEVDKAIDNVEVDLTGYATEKYVDEKIQNIVIPDADLTNYYTKSETDYLIDGVDKFHIGDEEPTDDSLIWISANGIGEQPASVNYVNTAITDALDAIGVAEEGEF